MRTCLHINSKCLCLGRSRGSASREEQERKSKDLACKMSKMVTLQKLTHYAFNIVIYTNMALFNVDPAVAHWNAAHTYHMCAEHCQQHTKARISSQTSFYNLIVMHP